MSKKGITFVLLMLVFSLVALSGNSTAQATLGGKVRKGAKLSIQKNDGQLATGELITVKKDSLLLLDSETNEDITVQIANVKVITIVKKSRGFQFGVLAFLAGFTVEAATSGAIKKATDNSQKYWLTGTLCGAGGVAVGMLARINKKIQIQGKSDMEIQKTLEKLNKKARVPSFHKIY